MNSTLKSERDVVLASGSATRRQLLEAAFVRFRVEAPNIDEEAMLESLFSINMKPRDIADAVADMKARKISLRSPENLVIGCDQVLEVDGRVYGKADSVGGVRSMLKMMRGRTHFLHSSAVVYEGGHPVWRHTASAKMTMRDFSDECLEHYLSTRGEDVVNSVGCYRIEDGGASLLSKATGDMFVILGMPLLELLAYLGRRGVVRT